MYVCMYVYVLEFQKMTMVYIIYWLNQISTQLKVQNLGITELLNIRKHEHKNQIVQRHNSIDDELILQLSMFSSRN